MAEHKSCPLSAGDSVPASASPALSSSRRMTTQIRRRTVKHLPRIFSPRALSLYPSLLSQSLKKNLHHASIWHCCSDRWRRLNENLIPLLRLLKGVERHFQSLWQRFPPSEKEVKVTFSLPLSVFPQNKYDNASVISKNQASYFNVKNSAGKFKRNRDSASFPHKKHLILPQN